MSMGLVVLIIWLPNITEHHCVNTPNSNSKFVYALFTQKMRLVKAFIFDLIQRD